MASTDIILNTVGNLTKDAEIRKAGDKEVLSFSIAVNTGFGKKEQVHYYRCTSWSTGKGLVGYMGKGSKVAVTGKFTESEYKGKLDKDLEIVSLTLVGSKAPEGAEAPATESAKQSSKPAAGDAPVDDLPF
jgi:single-strand DNA-binding protein